MITVRSGADKIFEYGTSRVCAVAAFLIKTAFLATLIWLTVRFVMGLL